MNNELPEDDNKYIKLENKEPFQVLLVKPNLIEGRDWTASSYLKDLSNDSFCEYASILPEDYIARIATLLEIHKYTYPEVKVHLISEETDYIMEMMYVDLHESTILENRGLHEDINNIKNEFATLLSIEGKIIYGNAIVTKTYIPSKLIYNENLKDINYTMMYSDITSENIENMLYFRANTKVITYDSDHDSYEETTVFGPLDKFAEIFFGEAKYSYKKKEIGFLKHNINIWYSLNQYGTMDVFGNVLDKNETVDKMIVFTMWTDNYRGNLTLDEFNKIKTLSKKINIDYKIPLELTDDSKDNMNRIIVKNKYRILNIIYSKYNLT